jgi:hypothetical protein
MHHTLPSAETYHSIAVFITTFFANFYEKALFVKVDLATAVWWKQLPSLPFALCFYSHSRGARLVARCIG